MSAHAHHVVTAGCYRCELNKDEVQYSEDWDALEAVIRLAHEKCRFPDEDLSIDAAEAVIGWVSTKEGRDVMSRLIRTGL